VTRTDPPVPELEAWAELGAAAVVFMRSVRTMTHTDVGAPERLRRALDAVAPGWRTRDDEEG
jgi:hypothetical protein